MLVPCFSIATTSIEVTLSIIFWSSNVEGRQFTLWQVMPGARIPVDGCVAEGNSYVDESMLTGEPTAVPKAPGNAVMGGTLNCGGLLRMRTTRVGSDTALAQIVQVWPFMPSSGLSCYMYCSLFSAWPVIFSTDILEKRE